MHMYLHTYLFVKAFDGEFASLLVLSLSIDDVHSAEDQSTQPGEGQQHDCTTSKSTAGQGEGAMLLHLTMTTFIVKLEKKDDLSQAWYMLN